MINIIDKYKFLQTIGNCISNAMSQDAETKQLALKVDKNGVGNTNLILNQITSAGAPTIAINTTAGNLNGSYNYSITFETATGETDSMSISSTVSPVNQQVNLTDIPISPDSNVIARNIYRNIATDFTVPTTLLKLVCQIPNNITTTYTDNIADINLGVDIPRINTSGGNILLGSQIIATANHSTTSFGFNSLLNKTGYANTSFGSSSLTNNTLGMRNCAFGIYSLFSNTIGYTNSAFGTHTLNDNTIGFANSAFGESSGQKNTIGYNNSFFGALSGLKNTEGCFNSFFGVSSGQSNTTGYFNTFIGFNAGQSNTTASDNTFVGVFAGTNNTTGADNTFIGFYAGQINTTGYNNTFIGVNAGKNSTTGYNNSFFGVLSGANNTTGVNNSFFGMNAGISNATGVNNSFFGANAGKNNTGDDNSFFGTNAGQNNSTGYNNSFFGFGVGTNNTTGQANSFFGVSSGEGNTTGYFNSFFGVNAGQYITTGYKNTFFGFNAGTYLSDGSTPLITPYSSIYIGAQSTASADGVFNEIVIGEGCSGNGSNTATIGNSFTLRTYLTGLVLKVGTATAGTAPAKMTLQAIAALLTVLEDGAFEYAGDTTDSHLFFTHYIGGVLTRSQLI